MKKKKTYVLFMLLCLLGLTSCESVRNSSQNILNTQMGAWGKKAGGG